MIDRQDVWASFRNELATAISSYLAPELATLPISPWVAAALLQKSIRRGERHLAVSSAATLLVSDPIRFWRRLAAIVFEDVGLGDLTAAGLVCCALAGKRLRHDLGGEWPVAAFLTEYLVDAPKCRATDDLFMAVELMPTLRQQRKEFAELSNADLIRKALHPHDLHERALAIHYIGGTDVFPTRYFTPRRGSVDEACRVLELLGAPLTMLEVGREGYRRTREVLALFLTLLVTDDQEGPISFSDDVLPEETMCGPVPGWALDGFTREGKLAIRRLLTSGSPFGQWARAHVPAEERMPLSIRALFHVEGGFLRRRRHSPRSDELRQVNEIESLGVGRERAEEALALMADALPTLNAIRAEIMEAQRYA